MNALTKAPAKAKASYLDLVRRFPLLPIRNEAQYNAAATFLKKLAIRDEAGLDAGEQAYLDALTLFVEDYQNKHHALDAAQMTALQALVYLMEQSAMTHADLGRVVGNRSLASQILQGRRELSKTNIVALARHFRVGTGLFLPTHN